MANLLERRYAVSILYASHKGCTRFGEFRQALGEIPPGTLAQRLVELERGGVSGGWIQVRHRDGGTGYVKAQQVWGA